jgi:nitrogen fixation protein FixH
MTGDLPVNEPQPAAERTRSESRHGMFWVGVICTLLGGQILMLLGMAYLATSDASFAIEPDYYQKGLNWDDTAAQLRTNTRLGWSLEVEVSEETTVFGDRTVSCCLTDRAGRPLNGAAVDAVAFAHARGNQRNAITLAGTGDGRYAASSQFRREGLWEFRFVVRRGPDIFTHTLQRRLDSSGGSRS